MALINWMKNLLKPKKPETIQNEEPVKPESHLTTAHTLSTPYSSTASGIEKLQEENIFDINKINFSLENDYDLTDSYVKFFLCAINGKDASLNHLAGYWVKEDIINFNETIQNLVSGGYLTYKKDMATELNKKTVETLKELCRNNGLMVSGKKAELINRITDELCDEEIAKQIGGVTGIFEATGKSANIIAMYKRHMLNRHSDTHKEMIKLIMKQDYDGAYKRGGMQSYLSSTKKRTYEQMVKSQGMDYETACAIFYDMTGHRYEGTSNTVYKQLDGKESAHHTARIFSEHSELQGLIRAGYDNYRILSTLDNRTCSTCGNLDGKVFKVNEARIGENCPPFHDGCRCTIIANIAVDGQRRARDKNNKSIMVPADMTYAEWKEKYIENDCNVSVELNIQRQIDLDECFIPAVDLITSGEKASASVIQRQFRIGYIRASQIIDEMEHRGLIGPEIGYAPRQIYIDNCKRFLENY